MIVLPVAHPATEAVAMMQIGPNPSPGQASPLPIPHRRKVVDVPATEPAAIGRAVSDGPPVPDRLATCLAKARQDPAIGLAEAHAWLAEGKTPAERVRANQCLGMILSQEGSFEGAESAFADAVNGVPSAQAISAVPLMGMAGNAALASGQAMHAVDWFDRALAVTGFADKPALGALHADRARALLSLGRLDDAARALDEAHRLAPANADGWLLSARRARMAKDYAAAQRDIEQAVHLDPTDPEAGLEAGVIAALDGRMEAARKSWDSVVALAPKSPEADIARDYLEQTRPAPTSTSGTAAVPEKKAP